MTNATERLQQERKRWRQDHPPGFVARPAKLPNGDLNLFFWNCLIPGKPNSPWAGGYYPLTLNFPQSYPSQPPVAKFVPPVPHVNVFPSGTVCVSFLHENEPGGWKPSITLRQILVGIQGLLDSPNPESPAHETHYRNYTMDRNRYEQLIREHAKLYTSDTLPETK
ncbi:SUMO-conjugating enzyme ubc9 [Tritrichomonas foetus]|uniref:SUMO-conjugating enzyme ubc9 n=1 Tax=Tritrichomonas foetus TaxID=1144522 RepID=A0A1J4J4R0_9EUKA|nr:SUMO-conjugating enzyme ubc9 [Tritrichomonas foetus]|eukprot:OHS93127.1 SUMO-conjugating enzyme ubc9 [Tritrichomonas foetus]